MKSFTEYLSETGDYNATAGQGGECVAVYPSDASRPGYFHLIDWCVSSASGPVLWMVKRLVPVAETPAIPMRDLPPKVNDHDPAAEMAA